MVLIFFELLCFSGLILLEQRRLKKSARAHDFIQQMVFEVLQQLRSGTALMSALCNLKIISHPDIAYWGNLIQLRVQHGLSLTEWNHSAMPQSLKQFLNHCQSFVYTGANPVPAFQRQQAIQIRKQYYQSKLKTKTTQIRLQIYLLMVFSWGILLISMIIFSIPIIQFLNNELALQQIALGLGLQGLCIYVLHQKIYREIHI